MNVPSEKTPIVVKIALAATAICALLTFYFGVELADARVRLSAWHDAAATAIFLDHQSGSLSHPDDPDDLREAIHQLSLRPPQERYYHSEDQFNQIMKGYE